MVSEQVFIVTYGAAFDKKGEFFEDVAYTHSAHAEAAMARCMGQLGGFFENMLPDAPHIIAHYRSSRHSIWLERLRVQ